MSKTAFIYPGQGAQVPGMGADFYQNHSGAKTLFDQAGERLGLDMNALCFEKNELLDLTEYTQAALVTTCLAMTRAVNEAGLFPDMTAGLSLGEYCAIAAAGGMDELDAIYLVRRRGLLMQNTVPAGVGSMCAVLGMDAADIENVIGSMEGVTIANYNCPGQIVITGYRGAVEEAAKKLSDAGAKRTAMLNVSGPFHSPLLTGAGEELGREIEKITLHSLKLPYVSNVTAETVTDIADTKPLLEKQIYSPVKWMQSMKTMIADGVDTFVEIGPGRTLNSFLRRISRDVTVCNIAKWEDVDNVVKALKERV